eukprot:Hpha_TRINITY_DN15593_c5_g2::TRINITY_DN15593_c5_g2_i3::g.104849::m.104849
MPTTGESTSDTASSTLSSSGHGDTDTQDTGQRPRTPESSSSSEDIPAPGGEAASLHSCKHTAPSGTPEPDDAGGSEGEGGSLRDQARRLYKLYEPDRPAKSVELVLEKYHGNEERLLQMLRLRHGIQEQKRSTPSPTPPDPLATRRRGGSTASGVGRSTPTEPIAAVVTALPPTPSPTEPISGVGAVFPSKPSPSEPIAVPSAVAQAPTLHPSVPLTEPQPAPAPPPEQRAPPRAAEEPQVSLPVEPEQRAPPLAAPEPAGVTVWVTRDGEDSTPLKLEFSPDACVSDLLRAAASAFGDLPPGELQATQEGARLSNRRDVVDLQTSPDRPVTVSRRQLPPVAVLPPVSPMHSRPSIHEADRGCQEESSGVLEPIVKPSKQTRILDSIHAPSTILSCTQFDSSADPDFVEPLVDWLPAKGAGVIVQGFESAPSFNGKRGKVAEVRGDEAVVSLAPLGKFCFPLRNLRPDPERPQRRKTRTAERRSVRSSHLRPSSVGRAGPSRQVEDEPLTGWGDRGDSFEREGSPQQRVRASTGSHGRVGPRRSASRPLANGSPARSLGWADSPLRGGHMRSQSLPRASLSVGGTSVAFGRTRSPLKVSRDFVPRCADTPPRAESPSPSGAGEFTTSYAREYKYSPATQLVMKPLPTSTLAGKGRDVAEETLCEDCGRRLGSSKFCRRTGRPHLQRVEEIRTEQRLKRQNLRLSRAVEEALGQRLCPSPPPEPTKKERRERRETRRRRRRHRTDSQRSERDGLVSSPLSVSPQSPPSPQQRRYPVPPEQPVFPMDGLNKRNGPRPPPSAIVVEGALRDPELFLCDLNGPYTLADAPKPPVTIKYRHDRSAAVLYQRDGRWHLNDGDAPDEWLYSSESLLGQWTEQPGSCDFSGVHGTPYPLVQSAVHPITPSHLSPSPSEPPTLPNATVMASPDTGAGVEAVPKPPCEGDDLRVFPGCAVVQVARRKALRDAVVAAFGSVAAARETLCLPPHALCSAANLRAAVSTRCGVTTARAVPVPGAAGSLPVTDSVLAKVFQTGDVHRRGRVRGAELLGILLQEPALQARNAEDAVAQRAAWERVADSLTVCSSRYLTQEEFTMCVQGAASALHPEGIDLAALSLWDSVLAGAAELNGAPARTAASPQVAAAVAAAAAEFTAASSGGGALTAEAAACAAARLAHRVSGAGGLRLDALWKGEPSAAVVTREDFCALYAAAVCEPDLLEAAMEESFEAEGKLEPPEVATPAKNQVEEVASPPSPPPESPTTPASVEKPVQPDPVPVPTPDLPQTVKQAEPEAKAQPQQVEERNVQATSELDMLRAEVRAMAEAQLRQHEEQHEAQRRAEEWQLKRERELQEELAARRQRAEAEAAERLAQAEALAEESRLRERHLQLQLVDAEEASTRRTVEDQQTRDVGRVSESMQSALTAVRTEAERKTALRRKQIALRAASVGAVLLLASVALPPELKKGKKGAKDKKGSSSGCCIIS